MWYKGDGNVKVADDKHVVECDVVMTTTWSDDTTMTFLVVLPRNLIQKAWNNFGEYQSSSPSLPFPSHQPSSPSSIIITVVTIINKSKPFSLKHIHQGLYGPSPNLVAKFLNWKLKTYFLKNDNISDFNKLF